MFLQATSLVGWHRAPSTASENTTGAQWSHWGHLAGCREEPLPLCCLSQVHIPLWGRAPATTAVIQQPGGGKKLAQSKSWGLKWKVSILCSPFCCKTTHLLLFGGIFFSYPRSSILIENYAPSSFGIHEVRIWPLMNSLMLWNLFKNTDIVNPIYYTNVCKLRLGEADFIGFINFILLRFWFITLS